MSEEELLRGLLELCEPAGLRVRRLRGAPGGEGEPAASSALCRVRGEPWIVLSGADSPAEQIAVVAAALRAHAPEWLERRYLPPALREVLEPPARGRGRLPPRDG